MAEDIQNWKPLSVEEVADLLAGLRVPWWIAGGWAIDLFLGRRTRTHKDLDLLIRRDDQLEVQRHLASWDLHKTRQPGLQPWPAGEFLVHPIDDVWCRRAPGAPWAFQLMLLDTAGDRWIFKRDPDIQEPLDALGRSTPAGVRYVSPEIQLLYKARPRVSAKDQSDFDLATACMSREARAWLLYRIEKRFPEGHAWITSLEERRADRRCGGDAQERTPRPWSRTSREGDRSS